MQEVDPDDLLGKAYDSRIVRRLAAFMLPYKGRAVAALGLIVVVTAADLGLPILFSRGVDEVAGAGRASAIDLLGIAFVATLAVRFVACWG